jgi:hypothetical protein
LDNFATPKATAWRFQYGAEEHFAKAVAVLRTWPERTREQILEDECAARAGRRRGAWRLNEPDAARVVQYFRLRSEGRPELNFDPEAEFFRQWIRDHGQSMDWISRGPRCMICLGAGRA